MEQKEPRKMETEYDVARQRIEANNETTSGNMMIAFVFGLVLSIISVLALVGTKLYMYTGSH